MDEQKQHGLSKYAYLMLAFMSLILGVTGIRNLTSNIPISLFRLTIGIAVIVSELVGFVLNLVVFLRQRKK